MSEHQTAQLTEVATVAVPTSDQDRALEFYVATLGFELKFEAPFGDGQRWIEVALPGTETTLALAPTPAGAPIGIDTGIRLRTKDADADHALLKFRGVDADPEVMRWPGVPPMFSFTDPDGNRLYIVEQVH